MTLEDDYFLDTEVQEAIRRYLKRTSLHKDLLNNRRETLALAVVVPPNQTQSPRDRHRKESSMTTLFKNEAVCSCDKINQVDQSNLARGAPSLERLV